MGHIFEMPKFTASLVKNLLIPLYPVASAKKPAGYYNENSADSIQKIIQEDFAASHSAAEKCHKRIKKGGGNFSIDIVNSQRVSNKLFFLSKGLGNVPHFQKLGYKLSLNICSAICYRVDCRKQNGFIRRF